MFNFSFYDDKHRHYCLGTSGRAKWYSSSTNLTGGTYCKGFFLNNHFSITRYRTPLPPTVPWATDDRSSRRCSVRARPHPGTAPCPSCCGCRSTVIEYWFYYRFIDRQLRHITEQGRGDSHFTHHITKQICTLYNSFMITTVILTMGNTGDGGNRGTYCL